METVRIDNKKLTKELAKHNITNRMAGIAVGHSDKYFSKQLVDKKAVETIELIYGIPFDAYAYDENSEESDQMVSINWKRLAELFKEKNIDMNTAGRAVGKSWNYLRTDKIRKSVADTIDKLYGIKLEQYQMHAENPVNAEPVEIAEEPKNEEQPKQEQPVIVHSRVQIDYDELYKTIYASVYEAIKMAMKEI